MDTKPARTLVLGLTLAVGAVVGLAPTSEARPVSPDPVLTAPTTPPHPDPEPDPDDCVGPICDAPGDLADPCSLHPDDCGPDVTEPGGDPDGQGDPTDPTDPGDDPGGDPADDPSGGSGAPVNPDIVVRTPRFTG